MNRVDIKANFAHSTLKVLVVSCAPRAFVRALIGVNAMGSDALGPSEMKLRIGMPDGHVETMHVSSSSLLSELVDHIRTLATLDPSKTRVRLITAGRLLNDFNSPLGSQLSNDDFIHVAVSDALPPQPNSPSPPASPRSSSTQPAVVITTGAPDGNGAEVRIVLHDLGERATERLTAAGFTPEEASALATQLRRVRAEMTEMRAASNREGRIRSGSREGLELVEETTAFSIASTVEGTNTDFLMGCVCGYLLGVLVLAMLLDKNITRRWRVGIVAGVATNLAFGLLRSTLNMPTQFPTP